QGSTLRLSYTGRELKTNNSAFKFKSRISGKSRIRTCEGFPTDLQSVLVGRLSIFPFTLQTHCLPILSQMNELQNKSPLFLTDCKCIKNIIQTKLFLKNFYTLVFSLCFTSNLSKASQELSTASSNDLACLLTAKSFPGMFTLISAILFSFSLVFSNLR